MAWPPFRYDRGTVTLTLQVQPGASRSGWAGAYGERALRLRVAAPAAEGKANRACTRFLARTFAVAPRQVEIVRGAHSRTKTVQVHAVSPQHWEAFRRQWADAEPPRPS